VNFEKDFLMFSSVMKNELENTFTNDAILKSCSLFLPFHAEKAYSIGKTAAIRSDHGPLLLPTIPLVD
jgi:hypothetical protein